MPKHRKVKFQPQTKKKKAKRSPQPVASKPKAALRVENIPTAAPAVEAEAAVVATVAAAVDKPEVVFELRRIGILGGVMLVVLVILALVL